MHRMETMWFCKGWYRDDRSVMVCQLLLLLLLLQIEGIHPETVAPTTESTESTAQTTENTTPFNLLIHFPQSAISLFSLGCFIGISMLVAMLTEKCYERLSLRDDSSDMSEHTKEILKARILGMVFGKKLNLSKMTDKQRAVELAKKYAHIWQYKAAMKKKRRIHEEKQKQEEAKKRSRRSSLFGILSFGKSSDDDSGNSPEKGKANASSKKSITKKPSVSTISEAAVATVGVKNNIGKDDFVSVNMKPLPTDTETEPEKDKTTKEKVVNSKDKPKDVKINMDNITELKHEDPDEFDIDDSIQTQHLPAKSQQKAQKTSVQRSTNPALVSEGSMYKYMRTRPPSALSNNMMTPIKTNNLANVPKKAVAPLTRQPSRPLTAGGSRPITAGAKRGTSDKDYKTQGKTVRSEVMKKLVP